MNEHLSTTTCSYGQSCTYKIPPFTSKYTFSLIAKHEPGRPLAPNSVGINPSRREVTGNWQLSSPRQSVTDQRPTPLLQNVCRTVSNVLCLNNYQVLKLPSCILQSDNFYYWQKNENQSLVNFTVSLVSHHPQVLARLKCLSVPPQTIPTTYEVTHISHPVFSI